MLSEIEKASSLKAKIKAKALKAKVDDTLLRIIADYYLIYYFYTFVPQRQKVIYL